MVYTWHDWWTLMNTLRICPLTLQVTRKHFFLLMLSLPRECFKFPKLTYLHTAQWVQSPRKVWNTFLRQRPWKCKQASFFFLWHIYYVSWILTKKLLNAYGSCHGLNTPFGFVRIKQFQENTKFGSVVTLNIDQGYEIWQEKWTSDEAAGVIFSM